MSTASFGTYVTQKYRNKIPLRKIPILDKSGKYGLSNPSDVGGK